MRNQLKELSFSFDWNRVNYLISEVIDINIVFVKFQKTRTKILDPEFKPKPLGDATAFKIWKKRNNFFSNFQYVK